MTDFELARRIETANAEALFMHSEVCAKLFPDSGAAAIRVAGGVASFVGAEVVISYAVGLGFDGEVKDEDIARIADFYTTRKTVPRIDVCPLAHESLLPALRKNNFQLHSFMNVLARPLNKAVEIPPPSAEINVREAEPDEAELWTRTVDAGFSEGGPLTEARRRLGFILFHRPGMRKFLAEINGQPIGGGALMIKDGYAALTGSSVMPHYRDRGAHSALIRTRLKIAQELGCDTAGLFALPGSISQRNAERHGFRLVYTKVAMKSS